MKDAEYSETPPSILRLHRAASLIVFIILAWFELSSPSFGSVRIVAAQLVAIGVIWFAEGSLDDTVLSVPISFRSIAWFALLGVPLLVLIAVQLFSFILS